MAYINPLSAPDGGWDDPFLPQLTVDAPNWIDTGLIDSNGNVIYRTPPPIGFGRDDEWD